MAQTFLNLAQGVTGTLPTGNYVQGTNSPSFHAYLSGNQTLSSGPAHKILWNAERYDSSGVFASNKFTVPSGSAGVYNFFYWGKMSGMDQNESLNMWLYLNNSEVHSQASRAKTFSPNTGGDEIHVHGFYTINLSVGDYVETYANHNEGADRPFMAETAGFFGYKLA